MSESLKLELQVGVSHPAWMLRDKPVFSGRAVSTPPLSLLSSPEFDVILINSESAALHKYVTSIFRTISEIVSNSVLIPRPNFFFTIFMTLRSSY